MFINNTINIRNPFYHNYDHTLLVSLDTCVKKMYLPIKLLQIVWYVPKLWFI